MEFQDEDRFFDVSALLCSGVYVLTWRGVVMYVGQSEKLFVRLYSHCSARAKRRMKLGGRMIRGIVFDGLWAMPVSLSDLNRVEQEMIDQYRPRYNQRLKSEPKISIEELMAAMSKPTVSLEPVSYIRRRL